VTVISFYVSVGRFQAGLQTLGVLNAIRQHPDAFKLALCASYAKLTADDMFKMLQPTFSEAGTNNRNIENRLYSWFRNYIQDLEGTICINVSRQGVTTLWHCWWFAIYNG